MMRRIAVMMMALLTVMAAGAATGKWNSTALGRQVAYTTSKASATAAKDGDGKLMTVVYLENLGVEKIGQNTNADDVAWLRGEGYQVVELDYGGDERAVAPALNADISAINTALQSGSFCGATCSPSRSYILMEGYRILRDISYYKDDPTVYNYPDSYKSTQGDSLYLDLVYPANGAEKVPVLVTFSYSNSHATAKHQRMFLPYMWGQFKDTFVEGASAVGFAWAVCDHPKYCDWGQGKYTGGANKSLGAIEVNPDAARKVRSAIRTVRAVGRGLGLDGRVAVTGFSRGSTAAALAVGGAALEAYDADDRGRFSEEESGVQCAVLGPGMFDYEHALTSSNEYTHMAAYVAAYPAYPWEMQGALATIAEDKAAATLFYHNTDDYYKDNNKNAQGLYATQAALMKERLEAAGAVTETLTGYSTGHAVPQRADDLQQMYDFLLANIGSVDPEPEPEPDGIAEQRSHGQQDDVMYSLMGTRVTAGYKGIVIKNGKKRFVNALR